MIWKKFDELEVGDNILMRLECSKYFWATVTSAKDNGNRFIVELNHWWSTQKSSMSFIYPITQKYIVATKEEVING